MAKKPAAKTPPAPTYPVNPALEAAVIAHAEEDTPRLVYADWLDENGDPDRAAFIRNQVALWDKNPADEDYVDLIERQEEFGYLDFIQRLAPRVPDGFWFRSDSWIHEDHGFAYQRGFPFIAREPLEGDGIKAAHQIRDNLRELFATTTIRAFKCFDSSLSQHLDVILSAPAATPLSALFIDNGVSESNPPIPVVRSVVDSPAAKSLRQLEISSLDPADMELLSRSGNGLRLTRVDTGFSPTAAAQIRRFLQSDCCRHLHRVRLGTGALNEAAVSATMKGLAELPELHTLESYVFGVADLKALAGSNGFRALGRLILSAQLRGAGASALAKAKLPRLAVLELHSNPEQRYEMQNQDVVTLATSSLFNHLRSLMVSASVGDKALIAISESASASKLRRLVLYHSTTGTGGLNLIATKFPALTSLQLQLNSRNEIPVRDVTRFLADLNCGALRSLSLNFPMSDAAAIALAGNPALSNLSTLGIFSDLHRNQAILKKGMTAILTSKYLTNLRFLTLNGKHVDEAAELLCDPSVLPRARIIRIGASEKAAEKISRNRPALIVR